MQKIPGIYRDMILTCRGRLSKINSVYYDPNILTAVYIHL